MLTRKKWRCAKPTWSKAFATNTISIIRAAYNDEGHLWQFPKTIIYDAIMTEEEIRLFLPNSQTLLNTWRVVSLFRLIPDTNFKHRELQ